MKTRLLTAALAVSLSMLWSCTPELPGGGGNSASGSVAVSRDDALVYAVDPDLDALFVVKANDLSSFTRVPVGRMPEKVLVGPDDTVYVANRYGRSVSIVRRGETEVAATLEAGVEPVGLAISTDGKTLFVVNSATRQNLDVGSVMAFDTATRQLKWETPVGPEPRAITLLASGKAMVTLFKSGDLVTLDSRSGEVEKSGTDVLSQLNRAADPTQQQPRPGVGFPVPSLDDPGLQTRRPRALEAITTNPQGTQVYVAALLSTDAVLNTRPNDPSAPNLPAPDFRGGGASGYGSSGPCGGSTPVAAPALLTFDENGSALVDDATGLAACQTNILADRPPMMLVSNAPGIPVQGPTAAVVDPSGSFLFIANRESNNVSIIPTTRRGGAGGVVNGGFNSFDKSFGPTDTSQQVVNVGSGPTGIALSRDGKAGWVYNAFDHSLSRLESKNGIIRQTQVQTLAADVLPPAVVAGRKLFFSATDTRMNNPQLGISCSTCHVEAREDGHIWNTTEGPRNTPSLIGKKLDRTAPFHWNGEFDTVSQFMLHTTRDRMGGQGPSPEMEAQLMAFITSVPAPDNPFTTETPADVLSRGRAAYEKAECGTCHTGEALTDNKFYDVGTYVKQGKVTDRTEFLFHGGLNTPSLLGIARTAPFLHDGSAPTLKARILIGKERDQHGKTSLLSAAEVDDLVGYLQSL